MEFLIFKIIHDWFLSSQLTTIEWKCEKTAGVLLLGEKDLSTTVQSSIIKQLLIPFVFDGMVYDDKFHTYTRWQRYSPDRVLEWLLLAPFEDIVPELSSLLWRMREVICGTWLHCAGGTKTSSVPNSPLVWNLKWTHVQPLYSWPTCLQTTATTMTITAFSL